MKILHIISEWKWTGPAEPVVNLCFELKRRGHDVTLAISKAPEGNEPVLRQKAIERGVPLFEGLTLRRRINPAAIRDIFRLKRYIREEGFDIVHTHLTHDHALAVLGLMGVDNTRLVRTSHKGVPLKPNIGNKYLMNRTKGLITVSEKAREEDMKSFSFSAERVWAIQNAIDLERFAPRSKKPEVMKSLKIDEKDVVVGIVARLQRHRRFDVFLNAMKVASERMPNLKAVVVGRGTHQEEVLYGPIMEMGLEKVVIPAGYRKDDYLDVLACFDMKVFLMPGSDGSCRAVRELMAMGKPVIAARRGMLPEIVDDGVNGLVIDDTVERLSDAITRLAEDQSLMRRAGVAAREKAVSSFSLTTQGEKIENAYNSLL